MDDLAYSFPFRDRTGYFKYIKLWKQDYKKISNAIRTLRYTARTDASEGRYAGGAQMTIHLFIEAARNLMQAREAAKAEAGRQMQARFKREDMAIRDVILSRHEADLMVLESLEF